MKPETIDTLTRWAAAAEAVDDRIEGEISRDAYGDLVRATKHGWWLGTYFDAYVGRCDDTVDIELVGNGVAEAHLRVKP